MWSSSSSSRKLLTISRTTRQSRNIQAAQRLISAVKTDLASNAGRPWTFQVKLAPSGTPKLTSPIPSWPPENLVTCSWTFKVTTSFSTIQSCLLNYWVSETSPTLYSTQFTSPRTLSNLLATVLLPEEPWQSIATKTSPRDHITSRVRLATRSCGTSCTTYPMTYSHYGHTLRPSRPNWRSQLTQEQRSCGPKRSYFADEDYSYNFSSAWTRDPGAFTFHHRPTPPRQYLVGVLGPSKPSLNPLRYPREKLTRLDKARLRHWLLRNINGANVLRSIIYEVDPILEDQPDLHTQLHRGIFLCETLV